MIDSKTINVFELKESAIFVHSIVEKVNIVLILFLYTESILRHFIVKPNFMSKILEFIITKKPLVVVFPNCGLPF